MIEIILSFDISKRRLGYEDAGTLRGEISDRLDKALKDAGVGRWVGGPATSFRWKFILRPPIWTRDYLGMSYADLIELRLGSQARAGKIGLPLIIVTVFTFLGGLKTSPKPRRFFSIDLIGLKYFYTT